MGRVPEFKIRFHLVPSDICFTESLQNFHFTTRNSQMVNQMAPTCSRLIVFLSKNGVVSWFDFCDWKKKKRFSYAVTCNTVSFLLVLEKFSIQMLARTPSVLNKF